MALSYAQLEGVWMQASQGTKYHTNAWAALMAAIAEAESSGIPDNTNPNDNGGAQTSWGLWQISLGNHSAPSPNWADPVTNAKLAIGKLDSQGLGAWGTYTSGAYKQYLNGSTTPNPSFPSGPGGTGTPASTTAASGGSGSISNSTDPTCAWGIGGSIPVLGSLPVVGGAFSANVCLIKKTTLRHAAGGLLMAAGGLIAMPGVLLLAAFAFRTSGGLGKAANMAAVVPGGQGVAAGLQAAQGRAGRPAQRAADRETRRPAARSRAPAVPREASRDVPIYEDAAPKVRTGRGQVSREFADQYGTV